MSQQSVPASSALVIGEALIDIVEREGSSEAPTEVVGGSPANVALGLSRLGVPATLLTHLAHDDRGERIASELRSQGVIIGDETFSAERTTTARAVIAEDGTASYHFDISWDVDVPAGSEPALAHAGSLGLFLEPGAQKVADLLGAVGPETLVSLDPNIRADLLPDQGAVVSRFEELARHAHVVKLSDEDAEWLYPGKPMSDVAGRLRALGVTLVVVTLGADGALAQVPGSGQVGPAVEHVSDGDVLVRVPIKPGPLVDTISAGDSFMASLLASVLGRGLEACVADVEGLLSRASCASAIAVSRAGANPPALEALDALAAGDDSVLG